MIQRLRTASAMTILVVLGLLALGGLFGGVVIDRVVIPGPAPRIVYSPMPVESGSSASPRPTKTSDPNYAKPYVQGPGLNLRNSVSQNTTHLPSVIVQPTKPIHTPRHTAEPSSSPKASTTKPIITAGPICVAVICVSPLSTGP